jgi:hypothetical protein
MEYLTDNMGIDPLTAWKELGIYRLSAVVHRLRMEGFNIITERKDVKNRFGENSNVAFYKWRIVC